MKIPNAAVVKLRNTDTGEIVEAPIRMELDSDEVNGKTVYISRVTVDTEGIPSGNYEPLDHHGLFHGPHGELLNGDPREP